MKMKRFMVWALLLMASIQMQAQGNFVIEGKVNNVKDGTLITLFRVDGEVGMSVAMDTLRNGLFRIEAKTLGNETEKMNLMGQSDEFPSMVLSLWVRSGSHVRISGDNSLLYTWKIDSDEPLQQAYQMYINDSYDLWNEYQRCKIAQNNCKQAARRSASDEEKAQLKAKYDSLEVVSDELTIRIDANTIRRMKQVPVDNIWVETLHSLAMSTEYTKNYPHRDEVVALYNGLSTEEKRLPRAMDTYTILFPPQIVEVGDEMVDADLYDLQGKVHRLADFKGKHILIDFWSRGCGPCIMALPEMKEISEMYKDRLTIVSLSSDTQKGWEAASKAHEMTWQNLNDLKGRNGLYAKYGVRGIPNYILISPEGRIIHKWMGYGKGSLKQKMQELLNAGE